ncbi:hypothetical protein EC968_000857 [Mortierella alpina]|nr:hypothetical protein EC968_000857 [Mortierella alpina]
MRRHIQTLRASCFDPRAPPTHQIRLSPTSVKTARYVLRGSLRTDGFRLQLLISKNNELNSAKYKRLPHDVLPNRLTSTVEGVDYYLNEVRNIMKTPQDVVTLWGCPPDEIKFWKTRVVFHNLAVKQKAVYQPVFKHRRWMQEQKARALDPGTGSISDIETALPPLRGEGACFANHLDQKVQVKGQLDTFYNDTNRFKNHKWDACRAKEEEYRLIGAQHDECNKVVIGVGLGKFSSNAKLTSLHESFQSYFVQKARSRGYIIVVGVNEYYTSKMCPKCKEFVGQVDIRRLYCSRCKIFMHRDTMAGHNVCSVIRGHMWQQQRPEYLQPVDKDGRLPWMKWITTERSKRPVGIVELMTAHVTWANEAQVEDGRWVEHVSFGSLSFWVSWEQAITLDETQKKLEYNAAIVRKETAIMAQQASLQESANSLHPVRKEMALIPVSSATEAAETEGRDSAEDDTHATEGFVDYHFR